LLKKRFGVSIPKDLYDKIEMICNKLGCTRSSIVIDALKNYFEKQHHLQEKHVCLGLLIVMKEASIEGLIMKSLAKYSKLVSSYNHVHFGRYCIEIYLVIGDSDEIVNLQREVIENEKPIETRYIPILEPEQSSL